MPPKDQWSPISATMSDPSYSADQITPNDSTDLARLPKALWVGVGGDIAMLGIEDFDDAEALVFKNVPSGSLIPFRARRIKATGTTASSIVAMY